MNQRLALAVTTIALLAAGAIAIPALAANPHNHTDHPGLHGSLKKLMANPDCTLKAPDNPLSAKGLATPYVLGSAGSTCTETNQATAAFVQATILDPATGKLSAYNPVVRDAGKPLLGAAPPVPALPKGAVVTIWTGFNSDRLKIVGPGRDQFVNFAQQAYANSPRFFAALRAAEKAGKVAVPPLGMANDGMTCPSSLDFSIVDQDQSDNNPMAYPAYGVFNGSDETVLNTVDKVLGCTTWHVPSLSDGTSTPTGPLQEEQGAVGQAPPVALVPGLNPFVTSNGKPNLALQNLYRLQVGQPPTRNGNDTGAYCVNLGEAGASRLKLDEPTEARASSPSPAATNMANWLAGRFVATWENLSCAGPAPITLITDANGVVTGATYK